MSDRLQDLEQEAPIVINGLAQETPEVIDTIAKDAKTVGGYVYGDSIMSLGKSAGTQKNKNRLKSIAEVAGGIAIPTVATIGTKMLIALAVGAAFPTGAAAIIIPAAFFAWSAGDIIKKAEKLKTQINGDKKKFEGTGMSPSHALLKALNEDKVKEGVFVGSAAMTAISAAGGLDPLTGFLEQRIKSVLRAGSRLASTFYGAAVQKKPDDVLPEGIGTGAVATELAKEEVRGRAFDKAEDKLKDKVRDKAKSADPEKGGKALRKTAPLLDFI